MEEPKEQSFDEKADAILDKQEQETPSDSSPEKETEVKEAEETKDAGADQQKKAESEETTDEKPKDPRDLAFRKGYNEAKAKAEKELEDFKKGSLSQEEVENFRKITSSPEYIRESMRAQGFKEDVIDKALREKGFEVAEKPGDDVGLIMNKLNLDPKSVTEDTRNLIGDVAKIANVLIQDRLGKVIPTALKPLQEAQEQMAQTQGAKETFGEVQRIIKEEGFLDYTKDVEPHLQKWLDENPNGSQADLLQHFKDLNHSLLVERTKLGEKKGDRDEKKKNLRQISKTGKAEQSPAKTGDFDKDADAFLDSIGAPV
jgi:hypothetical protein